MTFTEKFSFVSKNLAIALACMIVAAGCVFSINKIYHSIDTKPKTEQSAKCDDKNITDNPLFWYGFINATK